MKFFKTKWRVVTDNYAGYEVQCKHWWTPFWFQAHGINTFISLDKALSFIERQQELHIKRNPEIVWTSYET